MLAKVSSIWALRVLDMSQATRYSPVESYPVLAISKKQPHMWLFLCLFLEGVELVLVILRSIILLKESYIYSSSNATEDSD